MTEVTSDTHPEYFYDGAPLKNFNPNNGLFTAKDFSEIVLEDGS